MKQNNTRALIHVHKFGCTNFTSHYKCCIFLQRFKFFLFLVIFHPLGQFFGARLPLDILPLARALICPVALFQAFLTHHILCTRLTETKSKYIHNGVRWLYLFIYIHNYAFFLTQQWQSLWMEFIHWIGVSCLTQEYFPSAKCVATNTCRCINYLVNH